MKSVAFHNLGCKVNAYEIEVMQQMLQEKGYQVVPFDTKADIYIINTCTVTNIADRKSRQMLHRVKKLNPDSIVVAVGCYVQTDSETVEIAQMVLAGKINKNLVQHLQLKGGKAIGLCGIDGNMIEAQCMNEKLGFVGDITSINVDPITDVLEKGYIPVISTIGCDAEGNVYNINADTAASKIAGILKAESLISMTDVAGILHDKDDPDSLISKVLVSEAPQLMAQGVISGGMIPKVECCIEAIRRGVKKVFIIDGRIPHAILIETLTDEGIGTMFVSGDVL